MESNKEATKKVPKSGLTLWHRGEDLKKINVINPGDFDIRQSLRDLNFISENFWQDLGICDSAEVKERNNLMRLLFEDPKFRDEIKDLDCRKESLKVPTNENNFLYFYESEVNPYWSAVKRIISGLRSNKVSGRLNEFCSKLESDLSLEQEEAKMATEVSKLVENVAVIEGTFDVDVIINENSNAYIDNIDWAYIHGYKLFNSSYSTKYVAKLPSWLDGDFYRFFGITGLIQNIANKNKSNNARKSAVIKFYSENLKTDLTKGFLNTVLKDFKVDKSLKYSSLKFTLYFYYSKKGLRIIPISIASEKFNDLVWKFTSGLDTDNKKQKKFLNSKNRNLNERLNEASLRAHSVKFYSCFPENFFGREYEITSLGTDNDYRWFAIGHLYNHQLFKDVYNKIVDQRDYFFDIVEQLKKLSDVLTTFESKATELKVGLCIPQISFTEHCGVSFNNLAPISLVGKTENLIPITLDRINGQMVGLTGRHGGGKTITGKSILTGVYLALSGLPVFAENFKTDVKTVLGAVTNDEGDGSTATVFVQKVKNLLEEIGKVPVNESLIFIDEIGKGTQQDAGMKLGMAILETLSKGGNSVLFNTQLLELAEYAESNLNAICYKVNKEHEFTKGIAGGEIDALIKEIGLDKYLLNKN